VEPGGQRERSGESIGPLRERVTNTVCVTSSARWRSRTWRRAAEVDEIHVALRELSERGVGAVAE